MDLKIVVKDNKDKETIEVVAPTEVDWRFKGVMTLVKD